MNLRELLLTASIPIQKFMQKIHPPYAQTTVAQAEAVMATLKNGDILLSREAWHFTNYFIPGYWSHAAIYWDGKVVEAVGSGVQIVDFRDWLIEKHNWIVLRPKINMYPVDVRAFVGQKYDYLFSNNNKNWYCSELARYCQAANLPLWLVYKKEVYPDDFYKAAINGDLQVVHEHRDK